MLKNPGYESWSVVDESLEEAVAASQAASILHEVLERSGFSQQTLDSVRFEFGRVAVGSREEPLNDFQITLEGSKVSDLDAPNQALHFLSCMQQILNANIGVEGDDGPLFLDYLFSGSLVLQSLNLAESIRTVGKVMLGGKPGSPAP